MALEEPDVVDVIGLENTSGFPVLTLIDSWNWNDEREHLSALQEKLNSYFNFIESDQITETHPGTEGKKLFIDIIAKYEMPSNAQNFLKEVCDFAAERNVEVRFKHVASH